LAGAPGFPLPPRAPVVIVGGGAVGTSIAFHLAEAGVTDLVLVERDELGSGSTRRAAGGVRAQFSDPVNIQIGARSLKAFEDFGRRPGWEIDLRQVGYLFLLTSPEQVTAFERNQELQHSYGVPSRMLTPQEARQLSPMIEIGDVLAAAFSPDDGHATPEAVVAGYAAAARAMGAHLRTGCEVRDIELRGGQVAAVDLPVTPLRRQVLYTEPMTGLPPHLPMTIDFATSFYFHREGPGLLMGMSDPDETPGFKLDADDSWIPRLMDIAARRAPAVADTGIAGGWAGLYEMTPDHNAIIGEAGGPSRFLYATGFSGHGFLQAPAVGEVVRDLVLGRPPVVDVSPLSVDRFARHEERREVNVV